MANSSEIQVLSLGMSRTGTASMKTALTILGHKGVYHGHETAIHPEHCIAWMAAWDAKVKKNNAFTKQDWDRLLGDYTAITDTPAVCFIPELLAAYPKAKVILVIRDENAWLKSFKEEVIDTYHDFTGICYAIGLFDWKLMRPYEAFWTRLFNSADGYFHSTTREQMTENAIPVYREHNASVVKLTEPERLLRFDLKDGWKPLCAFLDVPVPNVPFPKVNEGDATKKYVERFVNRSMRRAGMNLAIGLAIFATVSYQVYSRFLVR